LSPLVPGCSDISNWLFDSKVSRSKPQEDVVDIVTNDDQPRHPEPIDGRRLVLSLGGSLLFFVLGLFLPAGTWTWLRGWLFLVVLVVASVVVTLYLRRVNPDVIAARINRHEAP
jgi:hypothetical protein